MEQQQQQQQLYSSSKLQKIDDGEGEFNLREWALRARMISRENTISRRFSASNISRFVREDSRSFRSNFTISSTASSPGYPLIRDEIDPSTYSFTTALKALQARTGYVWECLSPEGFVLNSKWSEAERYICNPLSGEFPVECLSAKTLSGRSLPRNSLTSRITMSAPLIYPSSHQPTTRHHSSQIINPSSSPPSAAVIGRKLGVVMTRDVGIQSTPPELSSGNPSPASSTISVVDGIIRSKRHGGVETRESDKEVEARGRAAEGNKEEMEKQRMMVRRRRSKWWRQSGALALTLAGRLLWGRKAEAEVEPDKHRNMRNLLCLC